ncbi:N-acetylmuramoyl-L-alanine amidase [Romboutsia ilealis]|uniref:N-acetylmuramoyl-L-alanine amidase n=1 Tax=Romboutsia faecis TaxID=2764597 RepID=A0ABR7JLQ5_9FIRM|nr:N-acetylmuramoyl-L-alanine amidase [Romboutsia faecis]MBC5995851.1 N-acetylmuramoyl-L-alanine amidase [Romboutsia faecis]MRN23050.1 N-acetylmuramoyl-L-alanine amidase [Romboutsia ilealis]
MSNLVILDSGHAEYVEGKQAPDKSLKEWDFNNQMQYKLKKRLEDHNISVYLTNPSPAKSNEMGLTKRATLANSYWSNRSKPNSLFISIHANAYGSTFNTARGTETYVAKNASSNSKKAAKYVNDEIVKAIKKIDSNGKDRGVKTENFTVIYKANMPSILIEYAFYTNKDDLNILKNNKDNLVEATVIAICKYFNITYKSPTSNNDTNKNESNNNTSEDSNLYYRVIAGSYKNKDNANKMVKELKSKGYSAFIVNYKE